MHRRSFLISLQLSQQSSLRRLLSAPSSSVRYDPGAATGHLVDRRHRFSLPGHVHIHFRQTLGQVTIAVHLGEPGEPRTTRLYWMRWTGPDWTLDLTEPWTSPPVGTTYAAESGQLFVWTLCWNCTAPQTAYKHFYIYVIISCWFWHESRGHGMMLCKTCTIKTYMEVLL